MLEHERYWSNVSLGGPRRPVGVRPSNDAALDNAQVTKSITTVKRVAPNERADLRINQWPQGFKRIKHETMPVRLVAMKEPNRETGAGRLFRVGEVQHGADRIGRVTRARCAYATRTVAEWPSKPHRQDPAGARHRVATLPKEPNSTSFLRPQCRGRRQPRGRVRDEWKTPEIGSKSSGRLPDNAGIFG